MTGGDFGGLGVSRVFEKELLGDLKALAGLVREVEDFIQAEHIQKRAAYGVQFALEELITNIIKYGQYDHDDPTPHPVQVRIEVSDREVVVTVRDQGPPFNPEKAPAPDFKIPVLDREPGGLGLFLLKKISDDFSYTRTGDANVVTVRFGFTEVG